MAFADDLELLSDPFLLRSLQICTFFHVKNVRYSPQVGGEDLSVCFQFMNYSQWLMLAISPRDTLYSSQSILAQ